jgi:predicted DNA-binding protein
MPRQPPKRAPRGSISNVILLRLSKDLRARLDAASKREGLSVAEYVRQAVEAILPPA